MDLENNFYSTKQGRYFLKNREKINQLKLQRYYESLTPES